MKVLVKGVRSVAGLCAPAAELKTRGNTINHIHKGSVGLPSSTMSSLRIVGGIELPFGAEIPPCTDSFVQLSQEEESSSSTEVTWGESNSAPMRPRTTLRSPFFS